MWRNQDESPESQRERLELVLEGTRLGMWDWNPQTNEVVFDERWAQMLGHSLDEIDFSLESWSSRVHPDDLEPCLADIQAHIEGRTDFYENVHRMRHADGRWVYILDRGRIVARDADGRPIRFTGTHTDITAQCEAERRARERPERRKHARFEAIEGMWFQRVRRQRPDDVAAVQGALNTCTVVEVLDVIF